MKFTPLMAAATAALIASPVFAAGSSTPEKPTQSETTLECEEGQVWNVETEQCVAIDKSDLSDNSIYDNARELAYDGQYNNALKLLARAENPRDPRILTYKGYANRKAGNFSKGMSYYRAALRADPNYVLARSYMGQALIQKGANYAAKQQLDQIASIAGKDNWPYQALEQALAGKNTDY